MIILYKGDDTGGAFGKRVTFEVQTDADIFGAKVYFELCGVRREFENVTSGDKLEIFFSHNETARFPVGTHKALVWLVDPSGKIRTLDNALPVRVTTNLVECYGADDSTKVEIKRSVAWDRLVDVPNFVKTINGNGAGKNGNLVLDLDFVRTINGVRPDAAGVLTLDIPRTAEKIAAADAVTATIFSPEEMTNKANLTTIRVPFSSLETAGKIKRVNVWGAGAGVARPASRLTVAVAESGSLKTLATSKNSEAVPIQGVASFEFEPFEIGEDREFVYLIFRDDSGAAVLARVGLVDVQPTMGYGIGINGNWQDNLLTSKYFAPVVSVVGERNVQQELDELKARKAGGGWVWGQTKELEQGETALVHNGDFLICRGDATLEIADSADDIELLIFTARSASALLHKSGAEFLDASDVLWVESFKRIGGFSYGVFFSVRLRRIGGKRYFIEGVN